MPLSKRTELAHAKRVLRRLREDEPYFQRRVEEMEPEHQARAIAFYRKVIDDQIDRVRQLELQISN
jgi:hypothetical protein